MLTYRQSPLRTVFNCTCLVIGFLLLGALYIHTGNTPTPDTCVLTRNGSVVCGELAP